MLLNIVFDSETLLHTFDDNMSKGSKPSKRGILAKSSNPMMLKCGIICLLALALLGNFCNAQYDYQKPSHPKRPQVHQQEKQIFEKRIDWHYPADPKSEEKPVGPVETRHPIQASTIAVDCREMEAIIEVKKDMFGVGHFINPADLTLGPCGVTAEDSSAQVLIFQTALHDCGATTMTTDDSLIYTFHLNYSPSQLPNTPVVRTSEAAVFVECHYPRKHNVSSLPLDPLWIPYSALKMSEEFLYFSLTLMTDDWIYARPSYQYHLGDLISIEASVRQFFHVPLRVFVDYCVATVTLDPSVDPRYAFIEDGCLVDGRLTGAKSKFIPRGSDDKLQFQLEAFKFQGADSGMLYITCHLRATAASSQIDNHNRACYYDNGWKEASGQTTVCGSCEPTGVPLPSAPQYTGVTGVLEYETKVTLGPIPISELPMA
uniref:Zona pellucida sperm-binding protein 3 n=1 Tax=Gouania willdenowi TaxID=441366 RepID=A0A8C5D4Q0_GOUWI